MKNGSEKGNASEVAATEASSVKNQEINQGVNMLNSTHININRAITVPFHGAELYVVEHNGQPYTPMKPVVTAMGLDWKSQHRKVAANEGRWGIKEILMPSTVVDSTIVGSADGKSRALTCIPVRKVAAWLTTIEPGKVKNPEVRARVIQYQNECDDALWQYWNEGVAVNARAAHPAQATLDCDRISPAQKQDLKEIVEAIVKAGVQGFAETWSRFQKKFRVAKYEELPATRYEEARKYLIAKLPNGYNGDVVEEAPYVRPMSLDDTVRLDMAFTLASQAAAQVQRVVFNGVMASNSDWKHSRFLLDVDAQDGCIAARAKQIESDAFVLPIGRFYAAIEDSIAVDPQTLTQLVSACTSRLGRMAQNPAITR